MAKQGNNNTIGEANVRITGDISDLKAKVVEAQRETEKVGRGRGGSRRGGTIGDDRRSTGGEPEGLSSLATLRRALGIGAFVSGLAASFFTLGRALREIITQERGAREALEQRASLLEQTAQQEADGLERISRALNLELAAFREGNQAERAAYAAAAFARGRPESFVQSLLDDVSEQRAQATSRLERERRGLERQKELEVLQRIEKILEQSRDEQRRFTDQAIGGLSVSIGQLSQALVERAQNSRR